MQLTFYLWPPVTTAFGFAYGDALMSRPSVFPSNHVKHSDPAASGYNPPGTGTTYPAPSPDEISGVAQSIMNWDAHHRANIVGKSYDSKPGLLVIQDAGHWNPAAPATSYGANPTFGLFRHPDDIVTGLPTVAPYQAYLTPYKEGGITFNAGRHAAIAAALNESGVNIGIIDHDIELAFDVGYMLPSGTAGNWYNAFLADARFTTEIAYGSTTMDDAFAPVSAVDAPLSWNTGQSVYHASNADALSWLVQSFTPKIMADGFKRAFGDPLKVAFPTAKIANYNLHHTQPLLGEPCYLHPSAPVDRVNTLTDMDMDSIVGYEMSQSNFDTSSQAGFEASVTAWLTKMELTTTGSVNNDIRLIQRTRLRRFVKMSRNGGRDRVYYIRSVTTLPEFQLYGYDWNDGLEDVWNKVQDAMDLGTDKFIIFDSSLPIDAPALADLVTIVKRAEAYASAGSKMTGKIGAIKISKGKLTSRL